MALAPFPPLVDGHKGRQNPEVVSAIPACLHAPADTNTASTGSIDSNPKPGTKNIAINLANTNNSKSVNTNRIGNPTAPSNNSIPLDAPSLARPGHGPRTRYRLHRRPLQHPRPRIAQRHNRPTGPHAKRPGRAHGTPDRRAARTHQRHLP